MLPLSVVQEVDRLLKEGKWSRRKIAARLRVSRGTVNAIASGRRGVHGETQHDDRWSGRRGQAAPLEVERCRRCGHLVQVPCLVCRARDYRARQKLLRAIRAGAGASCSPLADARSMGAGQRPRRSRVA